MAVLSDGQNVLFSISVSSASRCNVWNTDNYQADRFFCSNKKDVKNTFPFHYGNKRDVDIEGKDRWSTRLLHEPHSNRSKTRRSGVLPVQMSSDATLLLLRKYELITDSVSQAAKESMKPRKWSTEPHLKLQLSLSPPSVCLPHFLSDAISRGRYHFSWPFGTFIPTPSEINVSLVG